MKRRETPAEALTPAQLEIMELVWARGETTVAEVWAALSARRPVARNTVQTMLSRLHDRGWLRARAEGNAHVYAGARPRSSTLRALLGRLVDRAFAGSPSDLVAALLEARPVSAEEARRLRKAIDESEAAGRRRTKGAPR
jgi:predicted transcriptional regulator